MMDNNDLYPYCSKCDKELSDEERLMNKGYENLFFPICNECLDKHIKSLKDIINSEEGTN